MLKKATIFTAILTALILTHSSLALTWDGGYHIFDSGSEGEVGMINAATADITGGYIGILWVYDTCSATIDGSSLGLIKPYDNSVINFIDGEIDTLCSIDYSQVNVFGGNIRELDPSQNATMNLYVQTYEWDPDGGMLNGGVITGTWLNSGDGFDIDLASVGDINYITFIPEPSTISFSIVGMIILIRRRKNH